MRAVTVYTLAFSLLAAPLVSGCEDSNKGPDAGADRGRSDSPRPGERGAGDHAAHEDTAPPTPGRTVTFKNMCPFEVWVGYTGSSASQIACSKNEQCKSNVCNAGHLCECSDDSHCPSPQTCDKANRRCQCGLKGECGAHQKCDAMNPKWRQCFWTVDAPVAASGDATPSWRLAAYSGAGAVPSKQTRLPITGTARDTTQVWSGAFFPRAGCDGIGRNCSSGDCGKCNAWEGPSARPHTRVEMTLQNNQDWYNLSLIHGFNVPIMVAAEEPAGTKFDAAPTAPANQRSFWCGNPGGTAYATTAVTGTTGWEKLSCKYDFDNTPAGYRPAGWPTGYRFVTDDGAACDADAGCTAPQKCGLSYRHVSDGTGATSCGAPVGWWSADQICATKSTFKASYLDCTEAVSEGSWTTLATLLGCEAAKEKDSCYQSSPLATCCGCTDWALTVEGQTVSVPATETCGARAYPKWVDRVLPTLRFLRSACPLAYTYPFDDPASTWTCSTAGSQNRTGYLFTFCPDKLDGGVKPPPSPTCTCTAFNINSADGNGVTISDKNNIPIGAAAAVDGKGQTLPLTGYDPLRAPYLISITAVGGKVINACHVNRNDLGCLQPMPQADDNCDYYEFHGDCTVAVARITAP